MITENINRIAYFGDSQTDGGNLFELTSRLFTQPFPLAEFGYTENVTNGQNYADVTTGQLGADIFNLGFGGASALGRSPLSQAIDPALTDQFLIANPDPANLAFDSSFSGQVERYLASVASGAPEGDAVSIYIGLNDFNNFTPTDPANIVAEATDFASAVIQQILGSAAAMVQAGAGTVIINTLPLPSFFPTFKFASPIVQASGDLVISAFNDALATNSAALTALGADVRIVDLEAISAEIAADQGTFGFQTVAEQLYFGTAADPVILDDGSPFFQSNEAVEGLALDQFAFIDLFHPTEATHQIHGVFSAETLENGVSIFDRGQDRAVGDDGDDFVLTSGGWDKALLRGGDDVALTGQGRDKAVGGDGSDLLALGKGRDIGRGGDGDDLLAGGAGGDRLFATDGNDLIAGGLGADVMVGGTGDDIFVIDDVDFLNGAPARDQIFGGTGTDTLVLRLDDATRAIVEPLISDKIDGVLRINELRLTAFGIEEVVFAGRTESLVDLVDGDLAMRVEEAELWGFL